MTAPDIKTQHDRTIRRMIADGAIRREVRACRDADLSKVVGAHP